jgi:transcriptional regulator with XRE-family HTH domain
MRSRKPRETDVHRKLGDRIRKLRKGRRLTQAALAERAGMDAKYIGQIERAETNTTLTMLDGIATGLGITLSELFAFSPTTGRKAEEFVYDRLPDLLRRQPSHVRELLVKFLQTLEQ